MSGSQGVSSPPDAPHRLSDHRKKRRAGHLQDRSYGEEEIALLEEELLPAMAVFLARVDAIDRAIEADQELEVVAHQAR
jgi:hypothetical protein